MGKTTSERGKKTSNAPVKVRAEKAKIKDLGSFQREKLRNATRLAIYKLEALAGRTGSVAMNDTVVQLAKKYLSLQDTQWVCNA